MKKNFNIFPMLVLVVYGALTLVAVPLHHHAVEYVDAPQYHSVTIHYGNGCDVCTFASGSFTVSAPSESHERLADNSDKPFTLESPKGFSSLFSKEYPRRGPPAFLA